MPLHCNRVNIYWILLQVFDEWTHICCGLHCTYRHDWNNSSFITKLNLDLNYIIKIVQSKKIAQEGIEKNTQLPSPPYSHTAMTQVIENGPLKKVKKGPRCNSPSFPGSRPIVPTPKPRLSVPSYGVQTTDRPHLSPPPFHLEQRAAGLPSPSLSRPAPHAALLLLAGHHRTLPPLPITASIGRTVSSPSRPASSAAASSHHGQPLASLHLPHHGQLPAPPPLPVPLCNRRSPLYPLVDPISHI
jgi:hypothetical protein